MIVTLAAVCSLDGKTTCGDDSDIYSWTSPEDGIFFKNLLNKFNLVVMGRKTYEAARDKIVLNKGLLRVVQTTHPEKYIKYSVPGQLEFTNKSAKQMVSLYEEKGFTKMLIVGGSEINSHFLKNFLIDELYLSLEPKVFGVGKSLTEDIKMNVNFKLFSFKILNKKGTILLRYKTAGNKEE